MNLRQRLEHQAAEAGHPHPETATPTELLDIIDAAKHRNQPPDDEEHHR